ncbi:ATP-binding cassette domain-containing protein [Marinactinospora rubrisoli]|uniref:UvrABC system protein A n=1 Tax=Marinactinospora rubrisoli TaxID=2715399 RepID=A0ABW2KF28_9ACTN
MLSDHIRVVGAREHNLADISVDIPKHRLTVVTGVSGSGKSSLVFDTVAAEARRQLNETFTSFVRNRLPRYGQPDVDAIENLPAAIVVDQQRIGGNVRSTVGTVTEIYSLMRLLWSRAGRPFIGYSNAFSFNDPQGMCRECTGLGRVRTVDVDRLVDLDRSLNEGAIRFPSFQVGGWVWRTFAGSGLFDNDKPLRAYTPEEWRLFLHGDGDVTVDLPSRGGAVPARFEGLVTRMERVWLPKDPDSLKGRTREAFERVVVQRECPECRGTRLSAAALSCRVNGHGIAECAAMEAADLVEVIRAVDDPGSATVVTALVAQLERLCAIGLGYLTMDRPTSTLSGGESQRVKMVRHLGSSLTDMLYVFDEPSVGLHPHDVTQLTELLCALRDRGNTVLVVEHDPDVIAAADHVIDIGPGPGREGGRVGYQGPVAGLAAAGTPTGRFFGHRPAPRAVTRTPTGAIEIRGATRHNLRGVDVDIPTGVLTAVTGVAGSGKSTLVRGFLPETRPDVVVVDQSAIHASRRSSPATYTGILDHIRALFAAATGADASLFTANGEGGCPGCAGLGVVYTDLAFMDAMVSTCEQCHGRRFTDEALRHRLRGRTIADVLGLSVGDAIEVFPEPRVADVLRRLADVGLGYVTLGQPLSTLSGGERQRLKLADELDRPGGVYVFDEPTTGLSMSDTATLVGLLDRLVDNGGTVVVIEHNVDVVNQADWVIDLGPGAGRNGGRVVFQGTPADLARCGDSVTGRYLRSSPPVPA